MRLRPILVRSLLVAAACAVAVAIGAQAPEAALTLLSRDGRQTLPLVPVGTEEYVPLDQVAAHFGATVAEDQLAGGATLTVNGRTIIITPNQGVVSVSGRLVSLSAPVIRQGTRWLVPPDFLSRALATALGTRLEVRPGSRLVVVGDMRVPRVTARVEAAGDTTRVVFDIAPAAPARVLGAETGPVEIQIDADALDLALPASPPDSLLQGLTQGGSATSVRLVTTARLGRYTSSTERLDNGGTRLTVELVAAGAKPTPALPAPEATAPPAAAFPTPPPGMRTVVLDPGHGGDDTGVRGQGGTLEKGVTLAIANRLKALIEGRLGLRVFLTRDDDRSMTLDERTAFANNQQADAFISIHANGSIRQTLKGAEVYFLSLSGSAPVSAPPLAGAPTVLPTLSGGMRAIDLVLWDSAQEQHIDASSALAGFVDQALRTRVTMSPRGLRQAPLRVLVGANMPAVLVETGYLTETTEERFLASPDGQTHVAEALYDALVRFRDAQAQAATTGTPQ